MGTLPGYGAIPHWGYDVTHFVGDLYLCGAAGGAAFHFAKGIRGSARGARLAGAVQAIRANAPRIASNFSAYGTAYSAIEAAVSLARGRDREDDMRSSVYASAITWGLHGMRRGGAPAAARCALLGATAGLAMMGIYHVLTTASPTDVAGSIAHVYVQGKAKCKNRRSQ